MSLGFGGGTSRPLGSSDGRLPPTGSGIGPPPRIHAQHDGPSRSELAVEKIAGLLALATGVGLLGPLLFAIQQDEAEGVGAAVIAVLSAVTLVAGVALLLGSRADTAERDRAD